MATPVDVTYYRDLGFGLYNFRPGAISGVPRYKADPHVPGGRAFNRAAFHFPNSFPGRQGTLGRNVLRGFNLNEVNFTVRREFPIRVFNVPEFRRSAGIELQSGVQLFDPHVCRGIWDAGE